MANISDQAFADLYENLEVAFEAAQVLGDFKKAFEMAAMMRALEQADLVPHVVEVNDEGEMVH